MNFQNDIITIKDQDSVHTLTYQDALNFHEGTSWFGVAVAFRALQIAGETLSNADGLWHRNQLYIVSGHPGPGVRDAIEYVTHCVSMDHYRLTEEVAGQTSCGADMKFHWWVSNGQQTAIVDLQQGFVPMSFTDRLDRLGTDKELSNDQALFDAEKKKLADELFQSTAADNFRCQLFPEPLAVGGLPDDRLKVNPDA